MGLLASSVNQKYVFEGSDSMLIVWKGSSSSSVSFSFPFCGVCSECCASHRSLASAASELESIEDDSIDWRMRPASWLAGITVKLKPGGIVIFAGSV